MKYLNIHKTRIFIKVISFVYILSLFSSAKAEKSSLDYYPNILIIKIKNDCNVTNKVSFIDSLLNAYYPNIGITKIHQPFAIIQKKEKKFPDNYNLSNIFEIYFKANYDPAKIAKNICTYPTIEYAEPLYKPTFSVYPNDEYYNKQYYLKYIYAEQAWEITEGSEQVIIALIDTEFDWEHEDLYANVYINLGEDGIDENGNDKRSNSIDDDENGKIDDWHGWDFLSNTTYEDFLEGRFFEDNDTKIYDSLTTYNHGTFVGACISAITNNEIGIASLANKCKILPVKVRSDYGVGFKGHEGIIYAGINGAQIINCSWTGVGSSELYRDILQQIHSWGITLVSAGGNSNLNLDEDENNYLSYPYLISVGASNIYDQIASFSNYGILTTIYAPGKDIFTAVPYDKYHSFDGTSLSAPLVSAVAGLIKTLHRNWTPDQIRHQIRSTADLVFQTNNDTIDAKYFGRLNAFKAVYINQSFDSGITMPGIEYIKYKINHTADTLNTYDEAILTLILKNYLAPANDIKVELISLDSLIQTFDYTTIDRINNLEEKEVSIKIKLTNKAKWYHKSAKLIVKFFSTEYLNYQLLHLPIKPPPSKIFSVELNNIASISNLFLPYNLNPVSISSPNINTLWIVGNTNSRTSENKIGLIISTYDKVLSSKWITTEENLTAVKVNAVDENTAFLLTQNTNFKPKLLKTTNQGQSWTEILPPNNTNYTYTFCFQNQNNGVIIVNPLFSDMPEIYYTTNSGINWKKSDITLAEKEPFYFISLSGYKNNYIITSNLGNSYISNNTGKRWSSIYPITDYNIPYCTIYPQNTVSAIAQSINNYNIYRLALLSDNFWTINEDSNIFNMIEDPQYVLHSAFYNYCVVTNNNLNTIITEDKGKNWYPVAITNNTDTKKSNILCTSANDYNRARLWVVSDSISYIDFDNIFYPIDTASQAEITFHSYPNPNTYENEIKIQIYSKTRENIKIALFDLSGKKVKDIFSGEMKPNQYHTILWSSENLQSGTYFYKIKTQHKVFIEKLVIIR